MSAPGAGAGGTGDVQTVRGGSPLTGTISVPGDKSISHRALLLAALAEGTSTIHGLSPGEDVARTLAAVAALGAEVGTDGASITVHGGRSLLHAPAGLAACFGAAGRLGRIVRLRRAAGGFGRAGSNRGGATHRPPGLLGSGGGSGG